MHSSRSSKRSSLVGPEVFQMVTDKLTFLQNSYKKKCNINKSGHSRTTTPAQEAPLPNHLQNLSWTELQLCINQDAIACGFVSSGV